MGEGWQCVSLICVCVRVVGWCLLSPSPSSLLLDPGNQRSLNTPIIYMTELLLPLAYIQTVCGLMHIAAVVGSPLVPIWMCALVPYFKSFLYSLCSSNAVWVTQCYAFEPLQDELDVYAANRTRYVVRNWPFMCWNRWSGKYSSNEGSQLGVAQWYELLCHWYPSIPHTDPPKSTSWARCQLSRSADLFAWAR